MFTPAAGYIKANPLKGESVLGSGLKLPASMTEKDANIGEVIQVGAILITDEKQKFPPPAHADYAPLQPGDIIAYKPYTDIEVTDSHQPVVFVAFENVVAVKRGTPDVSN